MKPGPILHYYSVDLQIQTCTEPVLLKYGKLATKYLDILFLLYLFCQFMDIFTVWVKVTALSFLLCFETLVGQQKAYFRCPQRFRFAVEI